PVRRAVEHGFDIGGQPIEAYRAPDQAPQAEPADENERCDQRAQHDQDALDPASHWPRLRMASLAPASLLTRPGGWSRAVWPGGALVLTRGRQAASVRLAAGYSR